MSGERLICLAEETESRQKEDRILGINLLNNVQMDTRAAFKYPGQTGA